MRLATQHTPPAAADPAHLLEVLSEDLYRLIADVRRGARSVTEHDANVAEGERIAANLRAFFRGRNR